MTGSYCGSGQEKLDQDSASRALLLWVTVPHLQKNLRWRRSSSRVSMRVAGTSRRHCSHRDACYPDSPVLLSPHLSHRLEWHSQLECAPNDEIVDWRERGQVRARLCRRINTIFEPGLGSRESADRRDSGLWCGTHLPSPTHSFPLILQWTCQSHAPTRPVSRLFPALGVEWSLCGQERRAQSAVFSTQSFALVISGSCSLDSPSTVLAEVAGWDVDSVCGWLDLIGLKDCIDTFRGLFGYVFTLR